MRASTAMTRASRVLKPVVFLSLYFVCNFILFYFIFIFIRFGLVCFWFKVASGHFFGGYVGRQCRRGGVGGGGGKYHGSLHSDGDHSKSERPQYVL